MPTDFSGVAEHIHTALHQMNAEVPVEAAHQLGPQQLALGVVDLAQDRTRPAWKRGARHQEPCLQNTMLVLVVAVLRPLRTSPHAVVHHGHPRVQHLELILPVQLAGYIVWDRHRLNSARNRPNWPGFDQHRHGRHGSVYTGGCHPRRPWPSSGLGWAHARGGLPRNAVLDARVALAAVQEGNHGGATLPLGDLGGRRSVFLRICSHSQANYVAQRRSRFSGMALFLHRLICGGRRSVRPWG